LQSDNFNSLDDFGGGDDDDDEVLIDTGGRRPPGAKAGMENIENIFYCDLLPCWWKPMKPSL
jgi:hypothetical protein